MKFTNCQQPSLRGAQATKQSIYHRGCCPMDCFAALAMTELTTSVIPGRAQREPGISRDNF